ncbi:MAG: fibronectin type III domain-containing protein [Chthoniobacterales bacterium]|nr:fibronectin type III domain-containing protein [Chthoniobacterales bacterium]
MKRLLCFTYLILVFLIGSHSTSARTRPPRTTDVTLRWDRNPEPNITGYKVYYGHTSGVYAPLQTVAGTTATVAVANNSVFYFVVTAINSAGLESPFSAEVQWP